MSKATGQARVFLFLQGPHGPFFHRLGAILRRTGAEVWRVGFNAGDRAFWFHPKSFIPFRGTQAQWTETFSNLVDGLKVTDIVLYGDVREIHAQAIAEAQRRGLTVHVFEEGYMRPYWVTYERGGSNGHSRLMRMSVADMQKALVHATLIDYPRYFDPKTGQACPVEVVVDRLANNDLPRPGVFNRTLSKLQGLLTFQAYLWRR